MNDKTIALFAFGVMFLVGISVVYALCLYIYGGPRGPHHPDFHQRNNNEEKETE